MGESSVAIFYSLQICLVTGQSRLLVFTMPPEGYRLICMLPLFCCYSVQAMLAQWSWGRWRFHHISLRNLAAKHQLFSSFSSFTSTCTCTVLTTEIRPPWRRGAPARRSDFSCQHCTWNCVFFSPAVLPEAPSKPEARPGYKIVNIEQDREPKAKLIFQSTSRHGRMSLAVNHLVERLESRADPKHDLTPSEASSRLPYMSSFLMLFVDRKVDWRKDLWV